MENITNINYNLKIVSDNNKIFNLNEIFDKIDISMRNINGVWESVGDQEKTIISKIYSQQNPKEMMKQPPEPLLKYTMCPYCKNKGEGYHLETCTGPFDDAILTEEGAEFYIHKIAEVFEDTDEIFVDEAGERKIYVRYADICPDRGPDRLKKFSTRMSSFNNVISLRFQIGDKVLPVKVSKNLEINVTKVYTKQEEIVSLLKRNILDKFDNVGVEKSFKTSIDCIYKPVSDDRNINLLGLDKEINKNGLKDYKLDLDYSCIRFKLEEENHKFSIIIRKGGSVKIDISFIKDSNKDIEISDETINYIIKKLKRDIVKPFNKQTENDILFPKPEKFKGLYYDKKIMNTSIPWKIDKDKFSYLQKKLGSFPPQPGACQNRITKIGTLKKSDVKRPVPFSFSSGNPPMRGLTILDEGIRSTGVKLIGNRKHLYEPCCESLQGKTDDKIFKVSFLTNNNVIDKEIYDKMLKVKTPIDYKKFKNKIEKFIASSNSTKEKMFRRMMYGFPNNKFPEDSKKLWHIQTGKEPLPLIDENFDNKPTSNFIMKEQDDIYSAVYKPRTQLKNFGGNNQLERDSRKYKGLLDMGKEELLDVVRCYLDKFNILINEYDEFPVIFVNDSNEDEVKELEPKIVPIDSLCVKEDKKIIFKYLDKNYTQNGDELEEKNRKYVFFKDNKIYQWFEDMNLYIADKVVFHLKIEKVQKKNNIIKLSLPSGDDIPEELEEFLYTYKERKYLFVPPKTCDSLKNNKIYKFYFNTYKITNEKIEILPNQPLSVFNIKHVKSNVQNDEIVRSIILGVINPLENIFE